MGKYDGPRFREGKRSFEFEPYDREESRERPNSSGRQSWTEKANPFENEHAKTLPEIVQRRQEIEEGFQDYLKEKKRTLSLSRSKEGKKQQERTFQARRIPSPIYGYKKPPKKKEKKWNKEKLAKALHKEEYEFLLFEGYETEELTELWEIIVEEESPIDITKEQTSLRLDTPKLPKKRTRLYRSLSGIIQEDQAGENRRRRDVPGLFSDSSSKDHKKEN